MEVDLDGIIKHLGHVGKYQIRHLAWTLIPVVLCGLHVSNYIVVAPDVTTYRCFMEECNDTTNLTFWDSIGTPKTDRCSRHASSRGNFTRRRTSRDEAVCELASFDKNPCKYYVFHVSDAFIEEDIPCEGRKETEIGTVYSFGTLLALLITGLISDRFGRRHGLVVSSVLEGFLGMIKGLSVNYAMFLAMDFIEPTFGAGIYISAYILALELLTPSTRAAAGALISVYFATGQILMGLLAWVFPYWRTFLLITYAPSPFVFAFYWISDESIRWLISRHRYQEAVEILEKVAAENKKTLSDETLDSLRFKKNERLLEKKVSPLRLVFRSKILMLRLLKVSVWWVTCIFCYHGLIINSTVLKRNSYVNLILSAVMEILSDVIGYFGLTYFGRKMTIFSAFSLAGVNLTSFAFISKDTHWLSQSSYFLGKFFVALAFGSVYLYTAELFPTKQRHFLMTTCFLIGRIGSVLAPQTPLLAKYLKPFYLYAGTCLISAALVLTSPETFGLRLPETIEEAENISRRSRNRVDVSTLKLAQADSAETVETSFGTI